MNRHLWALVACALLATSCGGGTTTLTEESLAAAGQQAQEPTPSQVDQVEPTAPPVPTANPEPTATPVPPTPVPPTPVPTAVPASGFLLSDFTVGECFNDPDGESIPSDPVDCNGEHEYEVFFIGSSDDGPDATYRTGTDFTDPLFTNFCDPATIEFAGAPWDVLPFSTTVWTPSEADWIAGDRTFLCTAEAGLRDENPFKIGSAAGGTLVSDEGIVARSTLDGQRDLFFSFQASTLYPLTDGAFELPNLSPHVIDIGFLFAAPLQDVEGETSRAYDFNFESLEVTRLETGLEGWQLASPHFVSDVPAFLFAARETEADDWDLYLSLTDQDPVAITDSPADDHWPTLTPDGSQVVYHSGGDIWIMNADGTDKRQLTDDAGNDFESAMSPDGTQIAFASDRSGNDDIWIMNLDGSDLRNLTSHPGAEAWPFFSRDGSVIYFQTDRLGVQSNVMIMELDGSNQSYFSFEYMTNGALLPDAVTERFTAELPTIADLRDGTVEGIVPGPAGELVQVEHSTGRLIPSLPGGWEFEELMSDDVASMVAAPSIAAYNSSWEADGVLITLIDAPTNEALIARADGAVAATDSSCAEDAESVTVNEELTITDRRYTCGSDNAAVVVAVFDADTQVGVLFEGQWDREPSQEADADLINQIGELLLWG